MPSFPQTTRRRAKLSSYAIERNIGSERSRNRLGTIIPWKSPDRHPNSVQVLWDGTSSREVYHPLFLEEVADA